MISVLMEKGKRMRLIDADALLLLAERRRDGLISRFDVEMFPKIKLKIVMCKECKYSKLPGKWTQRYGLPGTLTCDNHNSPCHCRNTLEDWYCPFGEKK